MKLEPLAVVVYQVQPQRLPDIPEIPDTPDTPDTPDIPDIPDIPDTYKPRRGK